MFQERDLISLELEQNEEYSSSSSEESKIETHTEQDNEIKLGLNL